MVRKAQRKEMFVKTRLAEQVLDQLGQSNYLT
jgi:hypothetical protein